MIATLEGIQGSGKSLTATFLCYVDWAYEGRKIFSNNHLSFPTEGVIPDHPDNLADPEDPPMRFENLPKPEFFDTNLFLGFMKDPQNSVLMNCTLMLDEAYLYMDSRTSSGKLNKLFTYFLGQARKRDVDLYVCTHHILSVDKRLRFAADMRGTCRYFKEKPCKKCKGSKTMKGGEVCDRCMGYGEYGVAVTSFLDRRKMERTVLRVPGPWVWGLYETKEVLPVTGKQTQIKQEDL